MPKMKTHQGAAGRFVARKNGKLKRRRAGHNHFLEKKTPQQKRRLNKEIDVTSSDEKKLTRLLGER